jgi:hypothetical protein
MSAFEIAKAAAERLYEEYKAACKELKAIPGVSSGPMGLTPDAVKATPEYQAAKARMDATFQGLRTYNAWYTKTFKKELKKDRRKA